jgi:succinyl-diaminopimelate desuccinylase
MSATLDLACELIRRPSVTPDDAGCQELIAGRLEHAGFDVEHLRYADVDNLWVAHGRGPPLLLLLGHTDVVPPGPHAAWQSDPFDPTLRDGRLYGRGAADMKGSVAAMVTALERFVASHPEHGGTVALLLTSDEEGEALNGVRRVAQVLRDRGMAIDWCLVGEPTSEQRLGDTVKHGRRGSLGGRLIVVGVQGHVAYPDQADNPIHRASAALAELCATVWDQGNAHYPPTSFQISNIHAGTGADNVIPGQLEALFNFRYSNEVTAAELQRWVQAILDRHALRYRLEWRLSGEPFLTTGGKLLAALSAAIREETGCQAALSTAGGTSDGRFIAPLGAEVIEFGPVNRTIHKVDECVAAADLDALSAIYERTLKGLFA